MRLTIRVRPGASCTFVGGSYGDAPALVVRVTARAVDGRANESARKALAAAFSVGTGSVRLVSGLRARSKVVDIAGDEGALRRRLAQLLGTPDPG